MERLKPNIALHRSITYGESPGYSHIWSVIYGYSHMVTHIWLIILGNFFIIYEHLASSYMKIYSYMKCSYMN